MAKNKKNCNSFPASTTNDRERSDLVVLNGTVVDALPGTMFKVKIDDGAAVVLVVLSGKLRQNKIRVLVGDKVKIECSIYDLSRGRITWRY